MSRPKKGTKESEQATEKWRKTMMLKYGNITERMAQVGSLGGRNGHTGGFGSSKVGADGLTGAERARVAGKKGGLNSNRAGVKNGQGKVKVYYGGNSNNCKVVVRHG